MDEPQDTPEVEPDQADVEPQEGSPAPEEQAGEQEQLIAELDGKYRRAVADLQNAQRRFQKERERTSRYAVAAFAGKLLPMVDSMAHSLNAVQESHDSAALIKGFRLIETQLFQILKDNGIEVIDSVGKRFDPEVHHAVSTQVGTGHPPGTVVAELGRGFVMGDYVIRPAQVLVAAAPPDEVDAQDAVDGEDTADDADQS